MDAVQFGWLYLIENGKAGVEPSFYGGYDVVDKQAKNIECKWGDYSPIKAVYLANIRTKGVNWGETEEPVSDSVSCFTDTFHDPDYKEVIRGTLVLYGGEKQTWYADALECQNVFEMMAQASKAGRRFEVIFGEKP